MKNNKLEKIIKTSSFEIMSGIYIYCKVSKRPQNKHFMVTEDKNEITVVTTKEKLQELRLIERNKEDYKLISLNVSVPFYSLGFLAAVSKAIAEKGMNILIVSTYSKDYILIKEKEIKKAQEVLTDLGFGEN